MNTTVTSQTSRRWPAAILAVSVMVLVGSASAAAATGRIAYTAGGKDDRDRVFDRFVRLPDAETVEGSGLGLFIARRLVEMNGGRVRLLPAEPTGARFEMLVPRAAG